MSDEKRMVDSYEVKTAIHIGGKEIVLAEDTAAAEPFMVCDCTHDNPFSIDVYDNIAVSADYLTIMLNFSYRLSEQVQRIDAERARRGISNQPLTAADCIKGSHRANYKNQLIVIKPETLTPSARTADHQLLLATGGNGCRPDARGMAVFCKNLFTGESARWERYDVAGIIDPAKMPEWTAEKLAALQKPREHHIAADGTFAFGGYHFTPYRKFGKGEIDRQAPNDSRPGKNDAQYAMRNMCTDNELGISNYAWQRADYSHDKFYAASGGSEADIFKCVENGKLYVPSQNELFMYTESPQKRKEAGKASVLARLETAKKDVVREQSPPKEHKDKGPASKHRPLVIYEKGGPQWLKKPTPAAR